MRYEIILAPEAVDDLGSLKAHLRTAVRAAIEQHLRHNPMQISKSRIKRLRGMARTQFRLRVGEIRIFYDVVEGRVEVLAVVPKAGAETWLRQIGEAS
jgi:mRNA interferase RelE/StbE